MGRTLTVISVILAVPSFVHIYVSDLFVVYASAVAALIVILIGFWIENRIKTNGNDILNRLIYYLTKGDKKYIIESKNVTYVCNADDTYEFGKKYEIYPTCNDLDRIDDRFSWSAPSTGMEITPSEEGHAINQIWQQDMWTRFCIYFGQSCKKHKLYTTGALISKLNDQNKLAVPFLANTIDRKTKRLTMIVKVPKELVLGEGKLKVYSVKNKTREIISEDLAYDDNVEGFTRIVNYPRKGWKYVIYWNVKK